MSNPKKSAAYAVTPSEREKVNRSFSLNALRMLKKRYLSTNEKGVQETPSDMFLRVANAIAIVEKNYKKNDKEIRAYAKDFFEIMSRKEYTPAGRTMTNAGTGTAIVANCIVLPVKDSMQSIFQTLKDAALLQQAGSGLGFDFSHLRPALFPTKRSRGVSSGPVSFLRVYNEAFGIIKQQGRHGANMAMMQVDHPDILDFIKSKAIEDDIRNFNISIKVTDEFMCQLVDHPDTQWFSRWDGVKIKPRNVIRAKNGSVVGVEEISITVKELYNVLVEHAWANGEPGIVFIDEVNRTNPLPGLGEIDCSNPCGEQFLHHYDNCNLGSINLATFVKDGKMDWHRLKKVTRIATRMMDNVIDRFDFPVAQVTDLAQKNRRIGLGIMGFADMLYQMGIAYNSEAGRKLGEKTMRMITEASHEMSHELAKEKGVFPNFPLSIYAKKKIKMRNAALTTVAPTGSIAMMFDTSSGIEPNFALAFVKQDKDGHQYHYFNPHFKAAMAKYKFSKEKTAAIEQELIQTGSIQNLADLPQEFKATFVTAMDIGAEDHMRMQAAFQKWVDNSISKTINFPNRATREEVYEAYILAWKLKCKSATVYRDGSRNVQILNIGTGANVIAPTEIGSGGRETSTIAPQQMSEIDAGRLEARKRPEVLHGKTYIVKTGYGKLYVTVNNDERGLPFEVFATIGKSGGFFQEQSEGICRMISLALRAGIKIEEIIEQLKGIRGPMPTFTEKGTILSLPDALGKILEEHIAHSQGISEIAAETADLPGVKQDVIMIAAEKEAVHARSRERSLADTGMMPGCPDCGSSLRIAEGCLACPSCGFSRCT